MSQVGRWDPLDWKVSGGVRGVGGASGANRAEDIVGRTRRVESARVIEVVQVKMDRRVGRCLPSQVSQLLRKH